jgi:heme a synthase
MMGPRTGCRALLAPPGRDAAQAAQKKWTLRGASLKIRFCNHSHEGMSPSSPIRAEKHGPGGTRLLAKCYWFSVAYNLAVILWGAYVRVSGSGAGCGDRWPLCNGELFPDSPGLHTIIEFLHRATSGFSLLLLFALLVWCWRKTAKGEWARYSALLAMVLLLNEAILGALLVLFNHVGVDQSFGRAVFLSLHFANTLLLLASQALTAYWLSSGVRKFTVAASLRARVMVGLGLAAVVLIGITGTWASLSDTVFPPQSLSESLMQDFSAGSPFLLRLRPIHPIAAVAGALFVLWVVFGVSGAQRISSRKTNAFVALLLLQVGLGITNVLLLAPVWLQLLHLLIAELFWLSVVLVSGDLLLAPAVSSSGRPTLKNGKGSYKAAQAPDGRSS